MKIKVILLSLMSLVVVGSASAQIEQDDMYFNAKDRAKLREAEKANALAIASSRKTDRDESESNPTDSYSARNVNPEFVSRQNSKSTQEDESDYYVSNYQSAQRYYNNYNNNYNRWYNNPWYNTNYWGPSIMSWNSPYYGSSYDAWGNPWANPYYQSGFSTSFSYYYGNNWNYGWGMNSCYSCGYYNGYYDPFYSNYNPYYGYNSFYYNNYWNSPYRYYNSWAGGYSPYRVVVINHDNDYRASYGKRNSRSSQLSRDFNGGIRSNGRLAEDLNRGRTNSGGRSRESGSDNSWRNSTRTNSSSQPRTVDWHGTDNSRSTNTNNSRSSWESQQRSNTQSAPSRTFDAGRSSTPSHSSGGNSSGSGSRSSRRGN